MTCDIAPALPASSGHLVRPRELAVASGEVISSVCGVRAGPPNYRSASKVMPQSGGWQPLCLIASWPRHRLLWRNQSQPTRQNVHPVSSNGMTRPSMGGHNKACSAFTDT